MSDRRAEACPPIAGALLIAALLGSAPVFAQQPSTGADAALQVTVAQAMLDEARKLMAAGRFEEAREKIEASVRDHPSPKALIALGECHEKLGATASAWGTYQRAAERAGGIGDAASAREAARRAAAIEPRLTRVKVVVTAGEAPPRVYLDERYELGKDAWGTALPVDPGRHTVTASAPGRQSFWVEFDARAPGEIRLVTIPELAPIALPPLAPVESPRPRRDPSFAVTPPPPPPVLPPPKPAASRAAVPLRLVAGSLLFVGHGVGIVLAVDTRASSTLRNAGLAVLGATHGVGLTWAAVEIAIAKPPARQVIGAGMVGTGVLGIFTGFLIGCAGIGCKGGGASLSREVVITTLVGSLAVSPALIAGGVALLASSGRSSAISRSPPIMVAPFVGPGSGGLALQGSF